MRESAPVSRRPRGAAREVIIKSARELFARKGYDGTSLRDIATHAQVNESVIYRSVGTKDQIFRAAVLEPFHDFVKSFVSRWQADTERRSSQELVGGFVSQLYDMLHEHRELVSALVATNSLAEHTYQDSRAELSKELDILAEQTASDSPGRGMEGVDINLAVRCVTGMLMSLVVLDDWLLPDGERHPTRTHLLDEVSNLVLYGLRRS